MAELTLDVNSVSKNYKGNSKPAVNKVSLGIVPGEIMGILGPTGAGKSTLLRLMGGLAMPDSGDILLSGVSLYHDYEGCMSKIGYVPDRPELYSYMTGRKNLRVFAEMYGGTALSKIGDIISMLMLEDYIDLPVSTYPQGIKQLLAIGAALLNSPILLIIDEAMNGLDPLAIINLKERLLDLSESYGMSVVMTTHHLREIEGLCHRVAIMDKGGIAGLSTPKYLREQNSTHLGYRILLDRPDEAGAEINRLFNCDVVTEPNYIKVNVDQSKISSVLQILVKNGYFVYEAEELKTTFEEAYLKMIKDCMKKKGRVRQ